MFLPAEMTTLPAQSETMLESPALLIENCSLSVEVEGTLTISDPCSETNLGKARVERLGGFLLRLLTRRQITVFEYEDEPLLFTMQRHRGWSSTWEVKDADQRLVGQVQNGFILDRVRRRVAWIHPETNGSSWVFVDSAQEELALLESSSEGWRLTFTQEALTNPFHRMLLLASALARMASTHSSRKAANHVAS